MNRGGAVQRRLLPISPGHALTAPIGLLNGAIQEYHYLAHRGVRPRNWHNPIVHLDSWAAGDDAEGPFLEQHTVNRCPSCHADVRDGRSGVAGLPRRSAVRPLSLETTGLVLRYQTSRHYYRVALKAARAEAGGPAADRADLSHRGVARAGEDSVQV